MDAKLKINRALTNLLYDHPFYGTVATSVVVEENNTITKTMATNGKAIYWNRAFVEGISEPEVMGVMVHEIDHIVLKHMLRREHRSPRKWNIACDYAINPMIVTDGFKLPKGALLDKAYDKKSAEAIYNILPENEGGGGGGGNPANGSGDGGGGQDWGEFFEPEDMSPAEIAELSDQIDQTIATAATMAKSIGKLPGFVQGLLDEMEEAQVQWQDKIRRRIGGDQPDDYSMRRPNRKLLYSAGIVAPSINKIGCGHIVIGIDTSGSVSDLELKHFLGEMNAISEDLSPESVTIIYCDYDIQNVEVFGMGEPITELHVKGRGGTRVSPVFDYVEKNGIPVDHFLYFTDLEVGDYPTTAPKYEVTWVAQVSGGVTPPFGEVCRFKMGA